MRQVANGLGQDRQSLLAQPQIAPSAAQLGNLNNDLMVAQTMNLANAADAICGAIQGCDRG